MQMCTFQRLYKNIQLKRELFTKLFCTVKHLPINNILKDYFQQTSRLHEQSTLCFPFRATAPLELGSSFLAFIAFQCQLPMLVKSEIQHLGQPGLTHSPASGHKTQVSIIQCDCSGFCPSDHIFLQRYQTGKDHFMLQEQATQ